MRFSIATSAFLGLASFILISTVQSVPASVLPDGMPNPNKDESKRIELKSQGTLPNGPPPPKVSKEGIVTLQLIAFNELFEIAFFSELLTNVTNKVPGFDIPNAGERDFVLKSLTAILAQEELHALSVNNVLKHAKARPVQPCKYTFPVSNYTEAISLAATFTDLVLGTLQDAVERFALGSDSSLARLITAVVGQEGEQEGWYRTQQRRIPSQLPFLTTSDLNFAFTAVQSFIIPGSCPNIRDIPLKTFQPLTILTPPTTKTQNITVSWKPDPTIKEPEKLSLTYINQQNLPVSVPLRIKSMANVVVAEGVFPYNENILNGLTIAVVTTGGGSFPNVDAVAKATVFGPNLIIVN
ncbi:sexual development protein [Aspergillus sclerotialis]|uniref:Sexual development protein n=1 Tax=Aspergillus sclerotialis TaxID=2070753 RepID=A0A3A3A0P8_9EURO|nr:sexual development protein [Aspergillus sclerotialis]